MSAREGRGPWLEALLWLLLGFGLSPVWLDWGRHLVAEPGARYAALFLPLTALVAFGRGPGDRRASWGLALVALALGLGALSVGGGVTRVGRLALPLAVLGMAVWRGWPRLEVALASVWWVPMPSFLVKASGKLLALLPGAPGLTLEASDAGLPLAALLSGLLFHAALWRGANVWAALRAAALGGCAALPIQALAVLLALLAAGWLPASALRATLDLLPLWVTLALLCAAWLSRTPRLRPA